MKKSFVLLLLTLCLDVSSQNFRVTDIKMSQESDYKSASQHPSNIYNIEILGDSNIRISGEDSVKSLYVYDVDRSNIKVVKYRCSHNTSHCTVILQELDNNRYLISVEWDD